MQDTKVEWGYLGKGATRVMTMWLERACPMVIKLMHPGMRQIWVQIPVQLNFQLYNPMLVNFSKIDVSHLENKDKNRAAPQRCCQFSSVAQSCPALCDPMDCSTPGLPVVHQLPEFTQTNVLPVGDVIQPSHPLSSPSPSVPYPSQHQGLFQ